MSIRDIAAGTVVTVLIGGSMYSVSQSDIAKNLAEDTGMTREQAELYVSNVSEDELGTFDEIGRDFVNGGEEILDMARDIDCDNYEYEWESAHLSCATGKGQIDRFARDFIALGKAYIVLSTDSAASSDIANAIRLIDQVNGNLNLPVISQILDNPTLDETRNTNSYNKAILKAALESEDAS